MKKTKTTSSPAMPAEDTGWRANSDLRTLHEADEIRRDRGRHGAAKQLAKKQLRSVGLGGRKKK